MLVSRSSAPLARAFAIGDIHGCLSQLKRLAQKIEAEIAKDRAIPTEVIFLGDYVDRGPESRGVVEFARTWNPGCKVIHLKGNHEAMMMDWAAANPDWPAGEGRNVAMFLNNGGSETLKSYKGHEAQFRADVAWMESLFYYHQATVAGESYLFVHAGLEPGKALVEQDPEAMLWIRDKFLNSDRDFGHIIVHGHTPTRKAEIKHNRIGIDTGAVYGGVLTALYLSEKQPKPVFIQV